MIEVTLNGETRSIPEGLSVQGLVEQLQVDTRKIAIERNRAVVARSSFGTTVLEPGDTIEIVNFVGGG